MYVDFIICFSLLLLAAMLMGGWCHTNYFRHILKKKNPIIRPGLIFVQKAFFVFLFSSERIFRGAYWSRKRFKMS